MKETDEAKGAVIDMIAHFCVDEKWLVQRTGIEEITVMRPTSSLPVMHEVTALSGDLVRIDSTIVLKLPLRRQVRQNVLPDPNVTFTHTGFPKHTLTLKVALANLDPLTIDQMFADAMTALDALFEP
jgi:hypothetical protein